MDMKTISETPSEELALDLLQIVAVLIDRARDVEPIDFRPAKPSKDEVKHGGGGGP